MYPRQIENIATAHVHELRNEPSKPMHGQRMARRTGTRTIRSHAGWTLVEMGLRLASPASR